MLLWITSGFERKYIKAKHRKMGPDTSVPKPQISSWHSSALRPPVFLCCFKKIANNTVSRLAFTLSDMLNLFMKIVWGVKQSNSYNIMNLFNPWKNNEKKVFLLVAMPTSIWCIMMTYFFNLRVVQFYWKKNFVQARQTSLEWTPRKRKLKIIGQQEIRLGE